ncbi:hybrid PKS-NRPS PsoA [Mollisia scopiformis]|uniref:Hybrid PKS-NRPS PsoA n=1 Tax=Mollisia scopiformis TaxID=149040 RepID=A0A132BDL4_MOLSC|nr:hybrid PKS-NRPS PsoA [Mollisia scopiformis]KUJ10079.1 hybrid PKS-NRPS PsoA [Mollisia scopiformis]
MVDRSAAEPVAIIGNSCRFPGGSTSPSKLWTLLRDPVDVLTDIPSSRFEPAGFYHQNAEHPGTTNVTKAYLLEEDPWAFDNEFFAISAIEAVSMDPQQRVILETIYEAVEAAGCSISALRGSSTGVFVGQMSDDYQQLVLRDLDSHPQYSGTGISRCILANRVSYAFDWRGPSINVDTACSSSLVALHLAVQSVRSGECDMAVVAGVNLVFSPEVFTFLSSLRMLSSDGRSRMWDADANGYARGEGFAAVVIKSLDKALADGDDVESVIRNTGVNQDGYSGGLTVPSTTAQAELIRSTYTKCGLDYRKEEDRCQYFEAHGTGTPVGDPKEAEAISSTFFPTHDRQGKLHVGSIKTVVGHMEGTAGLGSLLKASLAVQHGFIPPNLHFNRLNPAIEPFYDHLEVPTRLEPWPDLPAGAPRRASINSFGFGGANAHAIIESWDEPTPPSSSSSPCWGPFVLSAHSETALEATISSLSTHLKDHPDTNLSSLAWTLQTRRTHFTHRASFTATSTESLISTLDSALQDKDLIPLSTKATKTPHPRILGVFTGQGAQWPTMGASLFHHSTTFRTTIQTLESVLSSLPKQDAPSWSLSEELLLPNNPARTSSATISQPLCTALQIALVDLLRESGITFTSVVGHSSGEIAAAYSAGILSPRDAILIAYYRGYHSPSNSSKGKMMAVGMSPSDGDDFCAQPRFRGRIVVAAKNSRSSITLSGDADAIAEAKTMLDEAAVFARELKVDNAYHSHHMERVREPYLASLKAANVQPRRNCFGGKCNWYSSVHDNKSLSEHIPFEDMYWAENITNPVLFSHAVNSALENETFDIVLEIGPHPALRGPATESIQEVLGHSLPYHGVLERNKDAVEIFSSALGFLWKTLDFPLPSFSGFQKACQGPSFTPPRVQKNLPTYPWDHSKPMLKESKVSKAWRTRTTPHDELLGYPNLNSSPANREVRWRNILRLNEVEWLQGHKFQSQVLLPAAGYLAMAVNAALHLVGYEQAVQLVELQDVVIHNGVTLEEDSPGVDINFCIRVISETSDSKTAEFSCHCSNVDAASADFDKEVFTGRVLVKLGGPAEDTLPARNERKLPLTDVTTERFYTWMQKLGLSYAEPFVLESIKRRLNLATVTAVRTVTDRYTIHPGTLDSILHSLYNAFAYPGDGRLWTTYLPKSFQSVRFNMNSKNRSSSRLVADCYLTEASARIICGDIDVFNSEDGHAEIQAQGVVLSSLEVPTAANDQSMFWETIWKKDIVSSLESTGEENLRTGDRKLHEICERTAYFYLNQLCREVKPAEIESMETHFQCLMRWGLDYVLPANKKRNWGTDTLESILQLKEQQYDSQIDLELIHHLGSRLPSLVRNSDTTFEVLEEDGRLQDLYTSGLGVPETNGHLGTLLDHLSHQHPRLRVLEIGAGTGGSTAVALESLDSKLEDYTFTDLSPSFFPAAQARFAEHKKVMNFQVLDIEKSPVDQEFQEHSYDVIIAAHVLHATTTIAQTVQHCRQLLRPGGYLIMLELINPSTLRIPFLFSGLPGWWLGHEDGRLQGPTLTEAQWDVVLRDNDFSGVDCALRDFQDDTMHTFSVMVSQAVDDRISILRDPLTLADGVARIEHLLIIGGRTLTVSKMAKQVGYLLCPFVDHTTIINDLEEVADLKYGSAVICLSGLEEATFARMDAQRLAAMQALFGQAKCILWTTRGCRDDDPYANIVTGIGRTVAREMEHLRLKLVDVDHVRLQKHQPEATMFSEMLLQMMCLDLPSYDGILWGNELEVAVEYGAVLIPRVVPNKDINDRFNSARRRITKSVSPGSTAIEISAGDDGVFFGEKKSDSRGQAKAGSSQFRVRSSSLFSFTCSDDGNPFYICLGRDASANQDLLAISKANSSIIAVSPDCTFSCNNDVGADDVLSTILTALMCESLLSNSTGTVWIHDADDGLAEIIHKMASEKEVSVFFTTSNAASDAKATYLHPRASERERRSLIPRNVKRFVNMGVDVDGPVGLPASFGGHGVDVRQGIHQVSVKEVVLLSYSRSSLVKLLEKYCSQPNLLQDLGHPTPKSVIKADLIQEHAETATSTSIISWTDIQSLQVQVMPATSDRLFDDQKTYLLVGLTGNVGLSLCEWMIDHGARYLAVSSRNPVVSPEVCKHFEKKGATVRIFALDVANMENLKSVHQEIISTMPPIGGVANAALVVRDHPFDGTSFEDLEAVFKPKVIGTQNLDNLFYSAPLEFFIVFSSVSCITGNPAQSAYSAANMFMSTVAMQRRKRGLAASVMHFGMLLGFGFIHEQTGGESVEARFRHDDSIPIPEPDFHAIFAQTILSGRPESGLNHELISGLGTELDTAWRAIPRLSHCRVKDEERLTEGKHNQEQSSQSTQDQLKAASDSKEALSILKVAIASRVSLALGSPGEGVDTDVGLINLGIDSLVAVGIRSWLLKILEVDIPVLKFLSGSSLDDICHDALSKLPDSSKPWAEEKSDDQKLLNGEVNGTSSKSSAQVLQNEHMTNGAGNHAVPRSGVANRSSHESNGNGHHAEKIEYERAGDMSHAQAQLYFLHEYLQNNAYNIAYSGLFHGRLDMKTLQNALFAVGKRHEALRSAYFIDMSTSQPLQAVLPGPRIILEQRQIFDDSEVNAEIDAVKDFRFDIEKGVVMKMTVLSRSPSLHSIIFNHHHIALDGIGWSVFIADLAKAYSGRLSSMPATPHVQQSIELAKKQLKAFTPQNLQGDLAFWKNVYKTIPEPLPLFAFSKVKTHPTVQNYNINTAGVKLSSDMTKLIDMAAAKIGVTSFHFFLASFATFLARCLSIDDIAIGVVDANRTEDEDMGTIGYFLNMLPVRIQMEHSEPFQAVAKRTRDAASKALAHSQAPLDMVLGSDGLDILRSTSRHPLFQAAINYRKAPLNETSFGRDGRIEWDGAVPGGHPYDMLLNVASTSEWTFVSLITQQSLYEESDGALLLKWYTRALEGLARDVCTEVGRCPISNVTDIQEALELGRGTDMKIPWAQNGTLTGRVDEIAAQLPKGIAIRDEQSRTLTYTQMRARMMQIAQQLQTIEPALPPGSYVAMLLDPVADAVCCILAILRLGFVWIPLDTRNHPQRLRAVVEESQPRVLVCHDATKELAQQISAEADFTSILSIDDADEDTSKIFMPQDIIKDISHRSRQPAMILYTSGTSGVPKGVMLTHGALVNQIYGTIATLRLGRETTLQQSPLGFDLMLDQIFLALCNGGTIVMVGKGARGDPTQMANLMVKYCVTLTHFVPSEYSLLLNYGHHILTGTDSWRFAMSGGEKLGWKLRRAFRKLDCDSLKLVNVYGPAEITLACARGVVPYRELSEEHDSSTDYLRPSPNYGLEIVDDDMSILPIGFPGEICISGQGVGLGYLNRPEDSGRKFTQRKRLGSCVAPRRIYRSADKGRILSDGTLQVLGRLDGDSQVKIHGVRVELDEIANAIVDMSNGVIVNAVASLRSDQPSDVLVAFVVFDVEFTEDKSDFLEWLRSDLPLPPFMKPTFIVPIDRIPATANGKIDRDAVDGLPISESVTATDTVTQKLSPLEEQMRDVWEEVLSTRTLHISGKATVQSSTDFFQVGGSSILVIKLKSLIEVQFGVTLYLPQFFQASTLSEMAALVGDAMDTTQKNPLMTSLSGSRGTQLTMNWDLEIASMLDGLPQPKTMSSSSAQLLTNGHTRLEVVLTGATGFIGRHLLSQLIQDPRVAYVHCIAIRPDACGKPRHLSMKSDKIIEYTGDLWSLNLGLSDPQFTSLAEHADVIIHNGADVSLLKTYQSLRRANVVSTRTLCEMAIPRCVPLHFVSTASVAKALHHGEEKPLLEVPASPAVPELLNSIDGYASSKWASETLLEKAAADNGLSAYVHRLAHVVGDDASELDAVGMLIKYSLLLGGYPRFDEENVVGKWDFVRVEDVAKDLVGSAIESTSIGRKRTQQNPSATFVHHCVDAKVSHEDFGKYLEDMAGAPLREIGMEEWLTTAREKDIHPLVLEFFGAFHVGERKMVLPIIAKGV